MLVTCYLYNDLKNSNLDSLNGKIISGSRLVEFTNGVGWIPFDANSTQKEPVFTANLVRLEVQTTEWISAVNASEYKKGYLTVYLNTKSTLERYIREKMAVAKPCIFAQ